MTDNTTKKINQEELEKAVDKLASISSASTIKYLAITWQGESTIDKNGQRKVKSTYQQFEKIRQLRSELQIDKKVLEKTAYIGEETDRLEKENQEYRKEILLFEEENKLIKQGVKDFNESNKIYWDYISLYNRNLDTIDRYKARIKANNNSLGLLYKALNDSVQDGLDLYQIAYLAIWEHIELIEQSVNNGLELDEIGKIIVEKKKDKKGNEKEITLKAYADSQIRKYINGNRNGLALKSVSIIAGEDENGNELLIQNSKLETMGGIDNLEDKIAFDRAFSELEEVLTVRQIEIVKLLVYGYSQKEIVKKLKSSDTAISLHLKAIRTKAKDTSFYKVLASK